MLELITVGIVVLWILSLFVRATWEVSVTEPARERAKAEELTAIHDHEKWLESLSLEEHRTRLAEAEKDFEQTVKNNVLDRLRRGFGSPTDYFYIEHSKEADCYREHLRHIIKLELGCDGAEGFASANGVSQIIKRWAAEARSQYREENAAKWQAKALEQETAALLATKYISQEN